MTSTESPDIPDAPDHASEPEPVDAPTDATAASDIELRALAFFSTWTVLGLFIDGWAHNVDKPEDFFTPWHAVLYSGFVSGVAWFAVRELRARRRLPPIDRLVPLGVAGFAAAAVGDGIWHTVFGVEVGVEALLSPTHLLLMTSGIAIVAAPARARRHEPAGDMARFWPVAVAVMLSSSVVAFFLQFASTQRVFDHVVFDGGVAEWVQVTGVVAVLVSNAIVVGTVAWVRRWWDDTPPGTYTIVLGGSALLMTTLSGFDQLALAVPLLLGGVAADALVAGRVSTRTILAVVPAIVWPAWFAVYDLGWGLGWAVELWTGSVVLAVLTGVGLDVVTRRAALTPSSASPPPTS